MAEEGPLSCVSSRFICVFWFIINVATRHIIDVYNILVEVSTVGVVLWDLCGLARAPDCRSITLLVCHMLYQF